MSDPDVSEITALPGIARQTAAVGRSEALGGPRTTEEDVMAGMLERVHHEIRARRDRLERVHAIQNAATPSGRHELEVMFQVAADRSRTA